MKFAYKEAIGTIWEDERTGWGGCFKLPGVTVELDAVFMGPETAEQSLQILVDVLMDKIKW